MLIHNKFQFILLLVLCCTLTPLQAAFDEQYRLTVGGSITNFSSKLLIDSPDGTVDREIDLEDVLGLDKDLNLGWIKGSWRTGKRHRVSITYMPIQRSARLTTQKDREIGGNIIKSGAVISTEVDTHTFDAEYIYSFYKKPAMEIGVLGGIYWISSNVELTTSGEIILNGSDTVLPINDSITNQSLSAPLPLIGIDFAYNINPQWKARASAGFMDLAIGNIDGRVFKLNINTEYYINKHVGFGAAFTSLDISILQNGIVLNNAVTYKYNGLQAYLVFEY